MSLLLVLFYFIGIPALVIAAAVWLWRKSESLLAQGLVMVGAMATLAGLLWLAQGEKWLADRKVRELCAKDGGVRVCETVTLPAERFDKWGHVGIPEKSRAKQTDEYYYESEIHYYRVGNPTLLRSRSSVVRKSDGMVLGEAVSYGRGGGDLPGPWQKLGVVQLKSESTGRDWFIWVGSLDMFVTGDSKKPSWWTVATMTANGGSRHERREQR